MLRSFRVSLGLFAVMLCAVFNVMGVSLVQAAPLGKTPTTPPQIITKPFSKLEQGLTDPRMQQERASSTKGTVTTLTSDPCLTYTYGVNGTTLSGTLAYSWAEKVGWCYNGTKVTYYSVQYIPQTSAGWSYAGIDSKTEKLSSDSSFFQANSTAKFGYACILPNGGGCAYYRFPWVNVVVYGNGTYGGSGDADGRSL